MQYSLAVRQSLFELSLILAAVAISIGAHAMKYSVNKFTLILAVIWKDYRALAAYCTPVKVPAVDGAIWIGQGPFSMQKTICKHSLIAVAISINLFACAGKFSPGELAGILTSFREYINAEAVIAVAFYALTIGYSWEKQQQNTEELE